MSDGLEKPSWADDRIHGVCGFTTRVAPGPDAHACARQIHGADVHVFRGPPEGAPATGDGLWTDVPGVAVAIRVADCVPVLLWDPEAGDGAVAAVHAGWRGTVQDIVGEALRVGGDELGVAPHRVRAAIGPSIGPCCFEVGDEVVDALRGLGLDDATIGLTDGPRGKPHVDLRSVNRALLRRRGVPDERIDDVGGCTFCEPARYESFRRDREASGRMRGVISLLGALLVAALAGCANDPPEWTDEAVAAASDDAREALADGRAEVAAGLLRDALAARPDDAHLRASLAMALHRQGEYAEASVQSRLALGADPTLWQAAYNLAVYHAAMGDRDAALRWLQAAVATGRIEVEDVVADPDLAPLEEDHRFAFYAGTGVLSRAEEDAVVLLHTPVVAVGERATVSVISIALNRPLMGEREPADVRLAGTLGRDQLLPVSRRETFSAGTEGGREYHQRTWHFTFVPTRPGLLPVGPFEVTRGRGERWTDAVLLQVTDGPAPAASAPSAVATPQTFFRAPSAADGPLIAAHRGRGGAVVALDVLSDEVADAPWTSTDDGQSRYFRFRAASVEELPDALPERSDPVFRSILVQRATEGWSHVLELR